MESLIHTQQPITEKGNANLINFLSRHTLSKFSVLEPYFHFLQAVCENVCVVGGVAREQIGYINPPHPDIGQADRVIRSLEAVSGLSDLSYLRRDFTEAYHFKKEQQKLMCDLDIIISPHADTIVAPLDYFYVFCTAFIDDLGLNFRFKPDGVSLSTKEETDRLKIDITLDVPSPFNSRAGNHLSFDDLRIPVDPNLNMIVDSALLNTDIPLAIIGDVSELNKEPYSELSGRKAIRFLVQSLLERDGKRVEIVFGKDDDEKANTLEWLLRSLAYIIVDRNRNPNIYYKFLYAVLNWPNFDPSIQFVITNAFKLASLAEAEIKSSKM